MMPLVVLSFLGVGDRNNSGRIGGGEKGEDVLAEPGAKLRSPHVRSRYSWDPLRRGR